MFIIFHWVIKSFGFMILMDVLPVSFRFDLMVRCWQVNAEFRPNFAAIVDELDKIHKVRYVLLRYTTYTKFIIT